MNRGLVRVEQPYILRDRGSLAVILPSGSEWPLEPLQRRVSLWVGSDATFEVDYWAYEFGTPSPGGPILHLRPTSAQALSALSRVIERNPLADLFLSSAPNSHGR